MLANGLIFCLVFLWAFGAANPNVNVNINININGKSALGTGGGSSNGLAVTEDTYEEGTAPVISTTTEVSTTPVITTTTELSTIKVPDTTPVIATTTELFTTNVPDLTSTESTTLTTTCSPTTLPTTAYKVAGVVIIGGQYLTFSTERVTWDVAKSRCSSLNGRLAVLTNPQAFHAYAYTNLRGNGHRYWLGGSDIYHEGTWTWINCHSMHGFPWRKPQPNSNGNEDCLQWGWQEHYNDAVCTEAYGYVCEHGTTPVSTTNVPVTHVCTGDSVSIGSQCLTFSDNKLNFDEAAAACFDMGRRLATIDHPSDVRDYVTANFPGYTWFWVGASDAANEGSWVWMDGQPLDDQFTWLGAGENIGTIENCMMVVAGHSYHDLDCSKSNRYICEEVDSCVHSGGTLIANQCLTFSSEWISWNDAKKACIANSGQLASLADSQAVFDYVWNTYGNVVFWVGGSDSKNEGTWEWLNGKLINNLPWGKGQPMGGSRENCLGLDGDYGYDDWGCTANLRYICEIDMCSNAGGELVNGQCFTFSTDLTHTWFQAKEACAAIEGGRLASINDTIAFHDYLKNNRTNPRIFWIGASDIESEGTWRWLDGRIFVPSPWMRNRPSEDPDNNWDCLNLRYEGYLDNYCYNWLGYICELGW